MARQYFVVHDTLGKEHWYRIEHPKVSNAWNITAQGHLFVYGFTGTQSYKKAQFRPEGWIGWQISPLSERLAKFFTLWYNRGSKMYHVCPYCHRAYAIYKLFREHCDECQQIEQAKLDRDWADKKQAEERARLISSIKI